MVPSNTSDPEFPQRKGDNHCLRAFQGRIEIRTLKFFLPPDPLVTLQLPSPRLESHIPTATSKQVSARVSNLLLLFSVLTLWKPHLCGLFIFLIVSPRLVLGGKKEQPVLSCCFDTLQIKEMYSLSILFRVVWGTFAVGIFQSTSCSFYCTLGSKYVSQRHTSDCLYN